MCHSYRKQEEQVGIEKKKWVRQELTAIKLKV